MPQSIFIYLISVKYHLSSLKNTKKQKELNKVLFAKYPEKTQKIKKK
jgi:hypothetical protein